MYGRKSGAKMQILVDSLLFYRVVQPEIQKIGKFFTVRPD